MTILLAPAIILVYIVLSWRIRTLTERVHLLESLADLAPAPRPIPERPAAPSRPPGTVPDLSGSLQTSTGPRGLPPSSIEPPPPPREWETLVGGSLLNKAGVLVLVIGIALFLSYSFSRLSPEGRVGLAAAVIELLESRGQ